MLERRSLGAKCCEEAVSMSVESAVLVCVRIGTTMLAFSSSSSTWSRCEKSPSAPGSTVAAKTLAAPSCLVGMPSVSVRRGRTCGTQACWRRPASS
jgi:hypothetical protein